MVGTPRPRSLPRSGTQPSEVIAISLSGVLVTCLAAFVVSAAVGLSVWIVVFFGLLSGLQSVSYTHLTLPTNREV